MANEKEMKSSIKERSSETDLKPDTTPDAVEDLNPANDERSLDIGESGQFAPGGYYNQQGVTKPRRVDLDEQVDSALNKEKK